MTTDYPHNTKPLDTITHISAAPGCSMVIGGEHYRVHWLNRPGSGGGSRSPGRSGRGLTVLMEVNCVSCVGDAV